MSINKRQRLEDLQRKISARLEDGLELFSETDQPPTPLFDERLIVVSDFLSASTFTVLRDEILNQTKSERQNLPGHRKGGAISYAELHHLAPQTIAFYHSRQLHNWCSKIIGEPVVPTPADDQISCALLVYDRPRDHINWHYDWNFYHGRHFTALLSIVNQHNFTDELSSAALTIKKDKCETVISTPPNTFVLFEGTKVLHKVTGLGENETRIILSMTFCTDPRSSTVKQFARRIKDTAFYGIRALWA